MARWHGGPLEHTGTSHQRIFWGMNQFLMKVGYHIVFLDLGERIGSEEENAAREAKHLRYIQDQGFGGALFYPYAYRNNRDLVQEVSRFLAPHYWGGGPIRIRSKDRHAPPMSVELPARLILRESRAS